MKKLGEFNWVRVCKELLLDGAYSKDYGQNPILFWDYITALRGCDLFYYHDNDTSFSRNAVEISWICKKYMTMLLRGKGIGRESFNRWFKKITKKIIRRLKYETRKLEQIPSASFKYLSHYLIHCRLGLYALYKVTDDEKYFKLYTCFNISPKETLLNYLRTLAKMLEEELKGGEK